MNIYLLRHGEAEDLGPSVRVDAERRLTAEGKERLQRAARAWRRAIDSLDRVYVSPLVRAQQTADVFAEGVRFAGERHRVDWLVPEANPEVFARAMLADAREGRRAVACVGHEPHLGSALALLLHGGGAIPFKKGMLVGVELEGVAAPTSRLVCCLTTKLAARLGERD